MCILRCWYWVMPMACHNQGSTDWASDMGGEPAEAWAGSSQGRRSDGHWIAAQSSTWTRDGTEWPETNCWVYNNSMCPYCSVFISLITGMMAMVSMDDSSLQVDSPLVDWLDLWVSSHLALFYIIWTGWTLASTVSWWQHHKRCHKYYYVLLLLLLLLLLWYKGAACYIRSAGVFDSFELFLQHRPCHIANSCMSIGVHSIIPDWGSLFQLGMDGYPTPASRSGRFSTNRWNPPPAGLYVARRVGFSRITVPRFALSSMSLCN